jgi:hypothetical protein
MCPKASFSFRRWVAAGILIWFASHSLAFAQGIQIVAGTYGSNCGQPRGNKTAHLASTCNGLADCKYKVDYTVIGDPAGGCQKDYVAEWRCGSSPEIFRAAVAAEAGYGSIAHLVCQEPREESHRGAIRVISATYGGNCRAPRGNVTNALAGACNEHADCTYKIDYTVLGDPAGGCQKDYQAEWVCGGNPEILRTSAPPEAGYGSIVRLHCEHSAPFGGFQHGTEEAPGGRPAPRMIQVVAGTYGSNCGQPRGNKTAHLASTCNGRSECKYKIDYTVIGDPAGGCQKNYVAEWLCGNNSHLFRVGADAEAGLGSIITLSCPH